MRHLMVMGVVTAFLLSSAAVRAEGDGGAPRDGVSSAVMATPQFIPLQASPPVLTGQPNPDFNSGPFVMSPQPAPPSAAPQSNYNNNGTYTGGQWQDLYRSSVR